MGAFCPPELLSCFHGNPCLAADLLCAGKGREKRGLEGGKDGWEREKAGNSVCRAGFMNGAVGVWMSGLLCLSGVIQLGELRANPGDV